jgi:hypothetical protein
MTESSEQQDARTAAELRALDSRARDVLAVLAVCGRASLSADELSEITEASDLRPTLIELERRGLVVGDEDRYSLAPPKRGPLKRLLATVDVVDRVLRGFIQIAEDGRLTLADLDAVVELTGIGAELERWTAVLRLAEAAETTLSVTHRVEDWVQIVQRRREAARAKDDSPAAKRADHELERLRASVTGGPGPSTVLTVLAAVAAAALGVGVGFAIGNTSSGDSAETVTATPAGETVTAATETVTETTTALETVTETTTTTTTVFTTTPTDTGGVE